MKKKKIINAIFGIKKTRVHQLSCLFAWS